MTELLPTFFARVLALLALGALVAAPAIAVAQEAPAKLPPAPAQPAPTDPPSPSPVPSPAEPVLTPAPTARPATSVELAVRATSGAGMYVWQWNKAGPVSSVVERAKAAKISHLIVRASSQSQGLYLGAILNELLPKAHAAGIKVVGYDPPKFEDVEADAQRAVALINYRAPGGHRIDAFGADIEPAWNLLTPDRAELYGRRIREMVGGFPLVAIVYPPNQVGARFPFAAVAKHFDVMSPMSYWRARTLDSKTFMAASIEQLKQYGKPVSAIGQAFAYSGHPNPAFRPFPPKQEFDTSMTAAKAAGAIGISFWVWEHAEPWVFDSIRDMAWPPIELPAGVQSGVPNVPAPKPQVAAPVPSVAPTPVPARPDGRVRAQAFGPGAVPVGIPARPLLPLLLASLVLGLAAAVSYRQHPVAVPADVRARTIRWIRGVPSLVLQAAEEGTRPVLWLRTTPSPRRSRRSAPAARSPRASGSGRSPGRAGRSARSAGSPARRAP